MGKTFGKDALRGIGIGIGIKKLIQNHYGFISVSVSFHGINSKKKSASKSASPGRMLWSSRGWGLCPLRLTQMTLASKDTNLNLSLLISEDVCFSCFS